MKKIVHITNDLNKSGGVQRLLIDLFKNLNNKFQFEVILTRGENEYKAELESLNIEVLKYRDLGFIGTIKRLNKADIVHSHLFPSNYIALFSTSPKVMTEHNSYYRRRDIPFVKTLESIIFKRYKKVTCISNGVKRSFVNAMSWNNDIAMVLYNGVALNRFSNVSKVRTFATGRFRLGMVGRLVPQKDHKSLIKSLCYLENVVELHIAGDGPLRYELETFAKENGVSSRVFFHGQITDVPNFLDSLNLYVQSSHWEGFGLGVVEAMAVGLPCLGSNVDGLNELLSEDMLFDVGYVEQLASLISKLQHDDVLYKRKSRDSLIKASEFSIESYARKHEGLYIELAEV